MREMSQRNKTRNDESMLLGSNLYITEGEKTQAQERVRGMKKCRRQVHKPSTSTVLSTVF